MAFLLSSMTHCKELGRACVCFSLAVLWGGPPALGTTSSRGVRGRPVQPSGRGPSVGAFLDDVEVLLSLMRLILVNFLEEIILSSRFSTIST